MLVSFQVPPENTTQAERLMISTGHKIPLFVRAAMKSFCGLPHAPDRVIWADEKISPLGKPAIFYIYDSRSI